MGLKKSNSSPGRALFPSGVLKISYSPIWKLALQRSHDHKSSFGQPNSLVAIRKKRQIRLAIIMSLTVLEFFIFYMPQFGVVLSTIFCRISGFLTFGNEMTTFCWGLWFLDATFNPLWITILAKSQWLREESNSSRTQSIDLQTLNNSSLGAKSRK